MPATVRGYCEGGVVDHNEYGNFQKKLKRETFSTQDSLPSLLTSLRIKGLV